MANENYSKNSDCKSNFMELIQSIYISEVENLSLETVQEVCDNTTFTLKMIIQQSLKFMDKNNHASMTVDDVKLGMKSKGVLPLYGLSIIDDEKNQVIDLHDVINEPLPKVPMECSLKGEHLAIEGVDPRVKKLSTNDDNNNNIDKGYNSVVSLRARKSRKRKHADEVGLVQILVPRLTIEQENFISETISSCMGLDNYKRFCALESLQTGICINPILSNFVNFIKRSVRLNIIDQTISRLVFVLQMCKALLDNKALDWEPYLEDVVESLVTCVFYTNNDPEDKQDKQISAFRGYAIQLLIQVFSTFKLAKVFESRACNILSATLEDELTPFYIQYCALQCLLCMGAETTRIYVLPHARRLSQKISLLKDYEGELTKQAKNFIMLLMQRLPAVILKIKNSPSSLEELREKYGNELGIMLFRCIEKIRKSAEDERSKTLK